MNLKSILLVVFTCSILTATAQDRIYMRRSGMMEVKIMYVSGGRIIYRPINDLSGKDKAIDWDDIHKVEYENGKVDFRHPIPEPHLKPKVYDGKNIVSFSPITIGDEGVGVGIAYERALDAGRLLSLYLPFGISYASPDNSSAFSSNVLARSRTVYQFAPGLRIYPTGNRGKARYAVGPQLCWDAGEKWTATPRETTTGTRYYLLEHHSVQKLGIMVNNSLNLYPSPNVYMGFDVGMGASFSHRLSGKEAGVKHLYQCAFRVGYRF